MLLALHAEIEKLAEVLKDNTVQGVHGEKFKARISMLFNAKKCYMNFWPALNFKRFFSLLTSGRSRVKWPLPAEGRPPQMYRV